ncbi:MAG: ABC transporter substrate-binding protein [Spirochaetales bacterium]|nr:ABC transporter substrate-binding protein [Spirochaetales bacterium]
MKRKKAGKMIGMVLCIILVMVSLTALLSCTKKEAGVIKIGAILAETGPIAFLGAPEVKTAKMLVDKINAGGGIDGRKIELIVKDSQASGDKAIAFANQLIEEDQVFAIIGPTSSGTSLAIKEICEEGETILMSCAAAEAISNPVAKYVFTTPQQDRYAAKAVLKTMQEMGITKVGFVYEGTGFGKGGIEQFEKYASDYGVEIAISESYNIKETDYTGIMTKVKGAGVQAVVNWAVFPAQSIIPKNMKQIGFNVPLFHSHGFGNIKYVEAIGKDAAEGILFPCGKLLAAEQLPKSDPQKKLLMDYKKEYEATYGEAVSTFGGHAYDALMMLVEAIDKEGPDKAKVRSYIENLKNHPGTGGVYNYSPQDHNGLGEDSLVMYQVKDGKFVLYK